MCKQKIEEIDEKITAMKRIKKATELDLEDYELALDNLKSVPLSWKKLKYLVRSRIINADIDIIKDNISFSIGKCSVVISLINGKLNGIFSLNEHVTTSDNYKHIKRIINFLKDNNDDRTRLLALEGFESEREAYDNE